MKKLTLLCRSVRVPVENKFIKKEELQPKFKEGLKPAHIANGILVLCSHPPVSSYLDIDKSWPSTNSIYHAIKSARMEIEIIDGNCFLETGSEFKIKNDKGEWGQAKTGEYDQRWFENVYASQRGLYQPGLVDDFRDWLAARYPDNLSTFSNLMICFEKEVTTSNALASDQQLEAWLNNNMPSQFSAFTYLRKISYWASLSKHLTKQYYVRPDGTVESAKGAGSVVTRGGPRYSIHGICKITIELPDDIFYKIHKDRVGGPMFATIGDSGVM